MRAHLLMLSLPRVGTGDNLAGHPRDRTMPLAAANSPQYVQYFPHPDLPVGRLVSLLGGQAWLRTGRRGGIFGGRHVSVERVHHSLKHGSQIGVPTLDGSRLDRLPAHRAV